MPREGAGARTGWAVRGYEWGRGTREVCGWNSTAVNSLSRDCDTLSITEDTAQTRSTPWRNPIKVRGLCQCQHPACDVTNCRHWRKMGEDTQNLSVLFPKTACEPIIISIKISIKNKAKHTPAVKSGCSTLSVCVHPRKTQNRVLTMRLGSVFRAGSFVIFPNWKHPGCSSTGNGEPWASMGWGTIRPHDRREVLPGAPWRAFMPDCRSRRKQGVDSAHKTLGSAKWSTAMKAGQWAFRWGGGRRKLWGQG